MRFINYSLAVYTFLRWRIKNAALRSMGLKIGKNSRIYSSNLQGLKCIEIDELTIIGPFSTIVALQASAKVVIGRNCLLTRSVQIYSASSVVVEDHCMIAGGVFIADTTHSTDRGDLPYSQQGLTEPRPVIIHEGAWIGQNSVIMPGCSIGKCSIIGANSVVTESIPPNTIAVGAPARVIKRFSLNHYTWERT